MTKTNKEFRSDLAQEMRDKFDKRNEDLNQIDRLPIPEELKEQSRKAIMENFEKEMDEMKKRPGYEEAEKTYLEEIKAKVGVRKAKAAKEELLKEYEEKLAKADADISDSKKSYEDAQISHRGKVEDDLENSEDMEIPQELKDFREKWNERIIGVDNETKEKIIKAVEKIPVKIETDDDGSRLIEFKLGSETYTILDPELKLHSDNEYKEVASHNWAEKNGVKAKGMQGNDVEKWANQKLKNYVKHKQGEGLTIATVEEIQTLLKELGKQANLYDLDDRMAMFMYLTGIYGYYRLSMGTAESSNSGSSQCSDIDFLDSNRAFRCFASAGEEYGNILMIGHK